MSLQPCRECGQEVSTEAKACPNCGAPRPTGEISRGGPEAERVGTARGSALGEVGRGARFMLKVILGIIWASTTFGALSALVGAEDADSVAMFFSWLGLAVALFPSRQVALRTNSRAAQALFLLVVAAVIAPAGTLILLVPDSGDGAASLAALSVGAGVLYGGLAAFSAWVFGWPRLPSEVA